MAGSIWCRAAHENFGAVIMWSVVCIISDGQVRYQLVQGELPEADFTGTRRQCLAYIRRMSGE